MKFFPFLRFPKITGEASTAFTFLFYGERGRMRKPREVTMDKRLSCHDMEMICRQRAVFDVENHWRWLSEAERWKSLGKEEAAKKIQGQMTMGPYTVNGDLRGKQMS
jgi:hypothetical protein